MTNILKSVLGVIGVLCMYQAEFVYAYVPVFSTQESLHDIEKIQEPEILQVFFGDLKGMPHTYEIVAEKPFFLSLELRTPQTASSSQSISGIVIKVPRKGRVEEITRLLGKTATWEMERDEMTYDTYLKGATYTGNLEPGTYRIEVHTPDNNEKYMLRIGSDEQMTLGYFTLVSRLGAVKDFYGTSRVWLIINPYVYVPLLVCVSFILSFIYMRRRVWIKV